MMTSPEESFQETLHSERQAVISPRQLAISLQREMLWATTPCDSWETEVIRLTKEVAEQNTKRRACGNFSHYSSVHLPVSGMYSSQPFTPTEKVESPFQPLRLAGGNPWKRIPSTSTALSGTRLVTDESTSKRKEAETFWFEPWPQASKLTPWKVSFRKEVTTGSTRPRLVSDWWLAEVVLASAMEE